VKNKIKLNPKYETLWKSDDRYHIVTGGRGSGKSFGVTLYLLTLTFEKGHIILFTRYTLVSAKTSIIPQFMEVMDQMGYDNTVFEVKNDEIINRKTGSKILFKGIRTSSGVQTANLKSLTGVTTWVLDEAEELTDEDLFQKIDYSVRVKDIKCRVILIMNPATKEHFIYERFFSEKSLNTNYIHTTYLDNINNISEDVINEYERLKNVDLKRYEHVVLGGWLDKAEGVIFESWERGEFPDHLPYVFGLDFGAKDPDALTKVAVDKRTKTVYIEEILHKTGLGVNDLHKAIYPIVGKTLIVADAAGKKNIIDLRKLGLNITKCRKPKVVDRIKYFLDFNIVVCGKSPNMIKEFNNYVWLDKNGEHPEDAFNHLMDSWMYGATKIVEGNRGLVRI
jgi:phage terminase large subunit